MQAQTEDQLKNAVEHFYSSHSLDLVFLEAVANSIDAGAAKIAIDITIESFNKHDTLTLHFRDNGCGFTPRNFDKLSRLLDVDETDHKGVGRLVYLRYFNSIEINCVFENKFRRNFIFTFDFNGESNVAPLSERTENNTTLTFSSFSNQKINSYGQLLPEKIRENILDAFLPIFFQKKAASESLTIQINLITSEHNKDRDFYNKSSVLTLDDIPELRKKEFILNEIDFTTPFIIYYKIETSEQKKLTTKICVDGRALPLKVLSLDSIPGKYQVIILVTSDILNCRTNASRQSLELPDNLSEAGLTRTLAPQIAEILSEHIPSIEKSNNTVYGEVERKYPHLAGLYDRNKSIGLVSENDVIEESQKLFFKKRKHLLDKQDELSDSDYYTALEYAGNPSSFSLALLGSWQVLAESLRQFLQKRPVLQLIHK